MLSKLAFVAGALQLSGTLAATISPSPKPTTCPTLCVDYVNPCGKTYGGCGAHCTGDPLPTFSAPPCASTTSATTTIKITTTAPSPTPYIPTTTASCSRTVCVDYLDACGQMYGGCYPNCPGYTTPTFVGPACSPTTTKRTTTTIYVTDPIFPIAKYAQCAGIGWNGSGSCAPGSTCTYFNPYYSQCL
ncbi:hypothetical protein AA313_de0207006 [Arthrobotrys entomopaga]|nr:hypothetical protein AA313_de0207006 [Arthrobotrys entomopaga]